MKSALLAAALAATCVGLTGCEPTGGTFRSTTTIDPMGGVTQQIVYELRWDWLRDGVAAMRGGGFSIATIPAEDIANMAIDYTTVNAAVIDGTGVAQLTLTSNGTPIASQSFPFTVHDSLAFASDPAAVAAWVATQPLADSYTVDVVGVQTVDTGDGTASVTGTAYSDGTPLASSGASWSSDVGTTPGCGDPNPEYPQEIIICP